MRRRPTTGVPVGRAPSALRLCPARAGRPAAMRWCTPGLPRSRGPRRGEHVGAAAVSSVRRRTARDATGPV